MRTATDACEYSLWKQWSSQLRMLRILCGRGVLHAGRARLPGQSPRSTHPIPHPIAHTSNEGKIQSTKQTAAIASANDLVTVSLTIANSCTMVDRRPSKPRRASHSPHAPASPAHLCAHLVVLGRKPPFKQLCGRAGLLPDGLPPPPHVCAATCPPLAGLGLPPHLPAPPSTPSQPAQVRRAPCTLFGRMAGRTQEGTGGARRGGHWQLAG